MSPAEQGTKWLPRAGRLAAGQLAEKLLCTESTSTNIVGATLQSPVVALRIDRKRKRGFGGNEE